MIIGIWHHLLSCHNVCLPNNARMWFVFFPPQWKSLSPHVDPHVGMMTTGVQWQWLSWFPTSSSCTVLAHISLDLRTPVRHYFYLLPSLKNISLLGMEDKHLPEVDMGYCISLRKNFLTHQSCLKPKSLISGRSKSPTLGRSSSRRSSNETTMEQWNPWPLVWFEKPRPKKFLSPEEDDFRHFQEGYLDWGS